MGVALELKRVVKITYKSEPALYKQLIHCISRLYFSNNTERFSYKRVGVAYVNVHVLRR